MTAASRPSRPVLRLSYNARVDFLLGLVFGETIDGHLPDEVEAFAQLPDEESGELDDVGWYFRRGPDGPLIGFGVARASAWDLQSELFTADAPIWDDPRFDVPTLALRNATVGEIILAAESCMHDSTPDVALFRAAVREGSAERWEEAELAWRRCLESGDMRAHFGLGYTLVELGRPREALGHLAMYTEICPRNPWAWVWRGRAAEAMGEPADAAACFRRALECEAMGADETDAQELLDALEARDAQDAA